jgi:hypothetical protein
MHCFADSSAVSESAGSEIFGSAKNRSDGNSVKNQARRDVPFEKDFWMDTLIVAVCYVGLAAWTAARLAL